MEEIPRNTLESTEILYRNLFNLLGRSVDNLKDIPDNDLWSLYFKLERVIDPLNEVVRKLSFELGRRDAM
jgi:hypothetical protein